MRRQALRIAVPACAAALGMAPLAARADVVPAPPGHASGVAAQVGSLLDISKTDATADRGAPSAQASVLRLGGAPVLNLGGTQKGDGETGGSLLDTGASLPARLQVAPWRAAVDGTHASTHHARSSAAVARAELPKVVSAGVLTSDSDASYTDEKSTGTAVTDGVQLGVLDAIRVVLLHSEVASEGKGHSYLIGLNGTEIGTNDQLGASPLCALNAPSLLSLSCLTASGGNGATGGASNAAAQVAQVTPAVAGLGALNPVAAFTAAAASGTGQAPAVTTPAPAPVLAAEASRAATAPAAAEPSILAQALGGLPRTGTGAATTAAGAFSMALLGFGLRRLGRRTARA
jgi:hypothetical protein